jgi:hypothetical protein
VSDARTCDHCGGPMTKTYWQLPDGEICDPCHTIWLKSRPCKHPPCNNDGRYDSGYCGVCDILHNDGRGKRL